MADVQCPFSERQSQALNLDVFVLEAILRTSQCSHGRTIYYRRMKMVVQALKRYQVQGFPFKYRKQQQQRLLQNDEKHKKKTRKRMDEKWTAETDKEEPGETTDSDDAVVRIVQQGLPKVLSRIEHASKPLFWELSRGFYLPQNSICVAALARIRALIIRMGQWVIQDLLIMHEPSSLSISKPELRILLDQVYRYDGGLAKDTLESCRRDLNILKQSLGIGSVEGDVATPTNTKVEKDVEDNGERDADSEIIVTSEVKDSIGGGSANTKEIIKSDEDLGESVVAIVDDSKPSSMCGSTEHDLIQEDLLQKISRPNKESNKKKERKGKSRSEKLQVGKAVAPVASRENTEHIGTLGTKETKEKNNIKKKKNERKADRSKDKRSNKKKRKSTDFFDDIFGN